MPSNSEFSRDGGEHTAVVARSGLNLLENDGPHRENGRVEHGDRATDGVRSGEAASRPAVQPVRGPEGGQASGAVAAQPRHDRSDQHAEADNAGRGDGGKGDSNHEPQSMAIHGFQLMSDVPEQRTEWFWQGRIPLGEVTILEGHPGNNKSSLTHDLAARLTQGKAMPCVLPSPGQELRGGALFLVGEDSLSKTVRARLVAAGADLKKIGVLGDVAIPDDEDMVRIEMAIQKIGAKLIVVDTLNDHVNCNVLNNQSVRKTLEPLRELAEEKNVAVVVIRHLVKSNSGHSLLRGGGSVGITAMARSQLKLFRHPDDPNFRVLIQDKCNLGPLSPPLLFELVPVEATNAFRLEWHDECQLTIEDLERKHKGSPALETAERLLLEKLADSPKEVNWLIEQARGICSKRTLDTAKKNLGLTTERKGKGQNHQVYWSLRTDDSLQTDILQGVGQLVANENPARS